MIHPNELIIDNFAGGGGASTGIEQALGRPVDIAINHDPLAIDMHKLNHPETTHYCESVWDVDPVAVCKGRPVGFAWFSPDCKHFSKAKGNKPVDKNIRGLAWVALRWAALVPVRVIMMENVEEFTSWGPLIEVSPGVFKPDPDRKGETFEAFVKTLTTGLEKDNPAWPEIKESLGDDFPYEKLVQGLGYQLDYRVLKACDYGAPTTRERCFLVARNDGEEIRWPEKTHGPKGSRYIPYRTAADIIDWSIPTRSIFDRKKPLAEKTLIRIAKGLEKYVFCDDPFIAPNGCVAMIERQFGRSSGADIDLPLATVTAGGGGKSALVTSHMIKFRGSNIGNPTDEPVRTISSGGLHIGEVRAFLIKYYGTSSATPLTDSLGAVTTKDRFGLVTVKGQQYQIVDIGMRMLEPHELFAAQGFPSDYSFSHDSSGKKLTKENQVARCGNAVCPPLAKALVEANVRPELQEIAA
ncbi:DNA cytosine methyltransferase [Vibrio quintilis]|uniref:DNA (cytosine-5-)-methyltransferase n=1 Tax=Vibrio quintilis TaxID=1117707 RepID=A0A1M7YP37_9VIBR|nr:DNA cytosine methyltransferase [Vibrio quintilis]SHO54368.1 C-5 cytosine-specific DNA methylase [Vibrio quintilis]